jgi:hypothetical protein
MPLLKDRDDEQEKPIYEGDSVEEITSEMRKQNAERLDVSEEQLERMPLSEIQDRIAEQKRERARPWWKIW